MSENDHGAGSRPERRASRAAFDEGLPTWSTTRGDLSPTQDPPPANVDPEPVASPPPVFPSAATPAEPVAPVIAERPEPTRSIEVQEPSRRRRLTPAILFGALALMVVAGGAGWMIGRLGNPSTDAGVGVGDQAQSSTLDGASDQGADDGTTDAAAGDGGTSTTVAEEPSSPTTAEVSTTELPTTTVPSGPFVLPDTPDNPSGAIQYAVMADGKAYMRGFYPDPEIASQAVADAAEIMGGMENVVDETTIDPRAEIQPDNFAVYLQDFILFETNSTEITEEFYEFLGFPLFFMQNNAAATVTVVARTDARGSETYNLGLSTRRAEAVRDFWLANGGNAAQIILDPRGEEGADENAESEQAALDRRVELEVSGFLAG